MKAAQCSGVAILDEAIAAFPDSDAKILTAEHQAYAIIGPAVADAALSLRALEPPATVRSGVESLLQAWDQFVVGADDVTRAASTTDANNLLNFPGTVGEAGIGMTLISNLIRQARVRIHAIGSIPDVPILGGRSFGDPHRRLGGLPDRPPNARTGPRHRSDSVP